MFGIKSIIGYLLENGVIDQNVANTIRVEQSKTQKSEEQILKEMNVVSEEEIVKAKSALFNIPYIDLRQITIPEEIFSGLNITTLKNLNAIPFELNGPEVKVAMLNPFDVQAIQSLRTQFKTNVRLVVYITTSESIALITDRLMGYTISSEVSQALEDVETSVTDLDSEQTDSLESANFANAPVARIVNSMLKYAIKTSTSDIHIEPMEEKLRVRFRIHGVMSEKLSLPKDMISSVVARIKIMSNLKIDEKRVPQDGRIQIKSGGSKIDVRVSTMPTIYGEKVVLRLLDVSQGVPPLESSGLRGAALQTFLDAITATNGIILITGPTGSGKTRTLAGVLSRLNEPSVNIITLENPVEIRIPGITQIQINPDVGLTFAIGLRSVLRQDPDIVMVGEIRDQETANLAVEASLTGHLVLATLHTNSAAAAIPRLIEMGIEPYLLASTLRCAAAQRLPRRICKHCIEAYEAPDELVKDLTQVMSSVRDFDLFGYADNICKAIPADENGFKPICPTIDAQGVKKLYLYRGKGCDRCNFSGYSGRIGIFEVMKITEEIGNLMLENVAASSFENIGIKNGMLTMIQDGYLKAMEGITTVEEVLRVSKE